MNEVPDDALACGVTGNILASGEPPRDRRAAGEAAGTMSPLAYACLAGLLHLVVDMASIGLLYREVSARVYSDEALTTLFLLYNGLAFATQPLLGLLADRLGRYSAVAAAGFVLAGTAVLVTPSCPLGGVALMGLGNALFHVGAGAQVLRLGGGRAALAGVMVGPGALGVWLGVAVGGGGDLHAATLVPLLLMSGVLMSRMGRFLELPKGVCVGSRGTTTVALCVSALLGAVVVRSLVGGILGQAWPGAVAIVLCAAAGKVMGGFLADRLGWRIVAVGSLLVLLVCLSPALADPATGAVSSALIQVSMAVTVTACFRLMPTRPGLAFGLPSLGLLVGALPQFLDALAPLLSMPLGELVAASAVLMLLGLTPCTGLSHRPELPGPAPNATLPPPQP